MLDAPELPLRAVRNPGFQHDPDPGHCHADHFCYTVPHRAKLHARPGAELLVHPAQLTLPERPRRAGDPPSLVADAQRIREVLGWTPKLDDLETIVRNQLDWEHRLQREPELTRN